MTPPESPSLLRTISVTRHLRSPFVIRCQREKEVHTTVADRLFEVEHLSLTYSGHLAHTEAPVLTDVSFTVERGDALTPTGPARFGKSTLLTYLKGPTDPSAGSAKFDARDVGASDPRHVRARIALVMQMPVLFEGSVRENLLVRALDDPGDFSESRLARALAEVGLDAALLDRDANSLRAGDKQRVAIARALLRDPQAPLLDEPIPAHDPSSALFVIATISRLRRTPGLSIVAVTRRPALVRRLGGSLLYLVLRRVQRFESAAATRSLSCLEEVTLSEQRISPPMVTT